MPRIRAGSSEGTALLWLFVAGCTPPPGGGDISGTQAEVEVADGRGGLATESRYEAVACAAVPLRDGSLRCEVNATVITPTLVVTHNERLAEQSGRWEYGHLTLRGRAPETGAASQEWWFGLRPLADGPTLIRHAVACFEQRLSGIAACCPHPAIDADPTGAEARRYLVPPPSRTGPLPSYYSTADPAFGVRGGCGVWGTQIDCEGAAGCLWGPTDAGMRCFHEQETAGKGNIRSWEDYFERCTAPLAADDAVAGSHQFLLLSERVDESAITPIPLATDYDPTTPVPDADVAAIVGRLGDVVGFGDTESGSASNGERRVALASTALSLMGPGDPLASVVTADGRTVSVASHLWGDGVSNGGAGHVDFGAPLLLPLGGVHHVVAINLGGAWLARDVVYSAPLTPATRRHLASFLDPDGDGIHRGFVDAREPSGASRPGYVDADGDGLSEHRVVPRSVGGASCVEAVPPLAGECWLPTGNDNCDPPPEGRWHYEYRNLDQRDRDGDGRGDACDTCPARWQASHDLSDSLLFCAASYDWIAPRTPERTTPLAAGAPVSIECARALQDVASTPTFDESDRDADGIVDLCDNCTPGQVPAERAADALPFANSDQLDRDGDGFGDHCDICPPSDCEAQGRPIEQCANPVVSYGGGGQPRQDARDADRDDVPDACDNCPGVANEDQADTDGDRHGDACDNCDERPNPAQQNCNLEAELELGRAALGDACDPAPCAETFLTVGRTSTSPLGRRTTSMDRIGYDARVGTEGAPVACVRAADCAAGHDCVAGVCTRTLSGRTTLRFCRCSGASDNSPDSRQNCTGEPIGPGDGGCTLLDLAAHDEPEETIPWRWTSQSGLGTNPTMVDAYGPPTGSFDQDRALRWALLDADVPRWLRTDIADDPGTPTVELEIFTPGAAIPGVLWTHTPGAAGMLDFDDLPAFGAEFRQRASYYWSGAIEPPITTREPFPCFVPFAPFLGGSRICPYCRGHVPQPWLAFPALFRCGGVRFDAPFVQLGGFTIEPNELRPFPGLEHFANDPGPWIAAAETGRWLHEQDGFRYAKLVGGALVERVLLELDGQFLDPSGNCPQPPCQVTPLAAEDVLAESGAAPPAREGHAAVLSATHGALFTIGGRDALGGGERRDLWRYELAARTWRALPIRGLTLGTVLAATYSPVGDRLLILDEVQEARRRGRGQRAHVEIVRIVRLLAISPEGGQAHVRASWPRRTDNTTYAMSVDPGGALWIAASPARAPIHVVVRLVDDDGLTRVDGWAIGPGRLLDARADDAGLTVVGEVRATRSPDLVHHPASGLFRVPGGERECF